VSAAIEMRQGPLTVEEIHSPDALAALGPAWDALAKEARLSHPFVSHLWTRTFWEAFGGSARLMVLVVHDGPRVVAIAPLARSTRRVLGLPYRVIGTIRNPHSPRCDLLVADRAEEACDAILGHLIGHAASWDVLELAHLPARSAAFAAMRASAGRAGLKTGVRDLGGSPFITLPERWDGFMTSLPTRHRANLRSRRGRLERIGPVRLENITRGVSGRDVEDAFRLEAAAWKGSAGSAIVSDASTSQFYRALAARADALGWLVLQFLTVGGKRVAAAFTLRYANRVHVLKSGYDPDFSAYSPGNLLCQLALEDAVGDGLQEYDFLGDSDPWKMVWTSSVRPHRWLYVFPDHLRARLLFLAKFASRGRGQEAAS
jgi:CelD/BcsL family acetyltransferase involved in cellulose biosynthesis